ncbi:hypothetical protein ER308_18075 [Egibacter rhizosphaerae]|uniref:DUF6458 domain-containing protein n=1 Tax=Egibacter rhizosphaerae TaxID=1670831 RepID=A0A411YJ84_9ACTN|nr:DUF6458 family protein [Egibacter rhizosphaerae]QBI21290.1 hypothetical protein ER308_18075 [Egibacter rhizosphaerae]
MTIGGSIGLIVLGAILAFAITADIPGVNLVAVGYILIVGGGAGLVAGLFMRNRRRVVREPGRQTVIEESDGP